MYLRRTLEIRIKFTCIKINVLEIMLLYKYFIIRK